MFSIYSLILYITVEIIYLINMFLVFFTIRFSNTKILIEFSYKKRALNIFIRKIVKIKSFKLIYGGMHGKVV